jgi:4-hydroxy-tetrahydrodipicolinate synthase
MVRLALRGEYPQALEIHHRFTELFKLLFVDGNPAGVKALLSEMGLIKNELRLPLVPARLGTEKRISELATELGIRI